MEFKHISVLLDETVSALKPFKTGVYADGTLGGGGHSERLAMQLPSAARLIGIDRDADAIAAAKKRLARFENVTFVNDNYKNIKEILHQNGVVGLDGAILDLGVSSYQIDNPERGFSYVGNAPLDMRMSKNDALTAFDVVNGYSVERLVQIFFGYGEERFSKKIAQRIESVRKNAPIETTAQLSDIIKAAIPAGAVKKGSHPAKRVFQAIRIEVNGELADLSAAVNNFFDVLNPGARLCIITFHSLEDRIVKNVFQALAAGCTCPKDFPVCVCKNTPKGKIERRKPIIPTDDETNFNSRAKSAKLRIIEKI